MVFQDPILAGTTLVRDSIASENYQAGLAGWRITRDGNAEFNLGTFRGEVDVYNANGLLVGQLSAAGLRVTAPDGSYVLVAPTGGGNLQFGPPPVAGTQISSGYIQSAVTADADSRPYAVIAAPWVYKGAGSPTAQIVMRGAGKNTIAAEIQLVADRVLLGSADLRRTDFVDVSLPRGLVWFDRNPTSFGTTMTNTGNALWSKVIQLVTGRIYSVEITGLLTGNTASSICRVDINGLLTAGGALSLNNAPIVIAAQPQAYNQRIYFAKTGVTAASTFNAAGITSAGTASFSAVTWMVRDEGAINDWPGASGLPQA